ncbi:hypothetical protein FKG94_05725 [Exilibacterium tricleocarpae]|uniref:Uncharacterized protein n=1 Tax=Exilibacterium tricleocarpae TaxID=2591008 RepID=A0A545U3V5_9GAMM|nr:hypothetical protein [Exilibacterium tricleocarpae]TQV84161.1 hypothetical protein FKG94_05725 [Exilibacterium tricleocarpae]
MNNTDTLEPMVDLDDLAEAEIILSPTVKPLDSRRRLEDKLEEYRLRKETREFDFDLESE